MRKKEQTGINLSEEEILHGKLMGSIRSTGREKEGSMPSFPMIPSGQRESCRKGKITSLFIVGS